MLQQRPSAAKINRKKLEGDESGSSGQSRQWKATTVHSPVPKVRTTEAPRRQKTTGITIVSHVSIKFFGFEPVFFLMLFQKIA